MTNHLTVLIVEDDPYIQRLCRIVLDDEGYTTHQAETGKQALETYDMLRPDIVLLDLGLPDMDGLDLIPLFLSHKKVPIIVISARSEESEKIRALDLGAEDYMCKPFHTGELMARIRVVQRRLNTGSDPLPDGIFSCDALQVDFNRQRVFLQEEEIHLTPIEYKLLSLLIQNRGKVLTHHFIQDAVWGSPSGTDAQNLRVFMANLRRKIEPGNSPHRYILTQVGIGYRFADK